MLDKHAVSTQGYFRPRMPLPPEPAEGRRRTSEQRFRVDGLGDSAIHTGRCACPLALHRVYGRARRFRLRQPRILDQWFRGPGDDLYSLARERLCQPPEGGEHY